MPPIATCRREEPTRVYPWRRSKTQPQIDFVNIGNADTVVSHTTAVGPAFLRPGDSISPRIIGVGFSLNF